MNFTQVIPDTENFSLEIHIDILNKKIENQFNVFFHEDYKDNYYLKQVMAYSLFSAGKRLRPLLVLEAGAMLCGAYTIDLYRIAFAIEMIHTSSLMHDDLPSMDNDDLRRGKPSSHKMFGEAMAILGGDALLLEPFIQLSHLSNNKFLSEILRIVVQGAGVSGMLSGQVEDLQGEQKSEFSLAELESMHQKKTGALIQAALLAGLYQGYSEMPESACLTTNQFNEMKLQIKYYADKIGLAFQITDDILDFEGDEKTIGKPIGSDQKSNKKTFVTFLGLEVSKEMAMNYCIEAREIAKKFFTQSLFLQHLPEYILYRKK